MKPGISQFLPFLTALLAGAVAVAQPPPAGFPGGAPPTGVPTKGKGPRPTPAPMPDSGSTDSYSYQRTADDPGYYQVNYSDGTGSAVVSETFLRMATNGPPATQGPEAARRMLDTYPQFVEQVYDSMMGNWYPDAGQPEATDFPEQTIGQPGGASAALVQDPLAPQYVRASLSDEAGQVEEFSVSRKAAEMILNRPDLTDAEKLKALKSMPMHLPESIRPDFKNLSREQLWAQVAADPKAGGQEFIRSKSLIEKVKAEKAARAADDAPTTDSAEATTAARETAQESEDSNRGPDGGLSAAARSRNGESRNAEQTDAAGPAPATESRGASGSAVAVAVVLGAALALGAVLLRRKRQL